ncbi:MAG: hypothetical protein U5K76_03840 [Woeseiaceae bacterium]|nr:hypothetical protein [Woeseiaceae bacterium]
MLRYQSRRFRCLMQESEQALNDAATGPITHTSRVARQVVGDTKLHGLWESRHAELVRPVAAVERRAPQVIALRKLEVQMLHRRALVDHVRRHAIVGAERDRLFAVFYGNRESGNAVLAEHRQYLLAVSSVISADHLIDVMHDDVSTRLLRLYADAYRDYFQYYCLVATEADPLMADALRPTMMEARNRAVRIRKRLESADPARDFSHFDRQLDVARSGRYPILNYMVG